MSRGMKFKLFVKMETGHGTITKGRMIDRLHKYRMHTAQRAYVEPVCTMFPRSWVLVTLCDPFIELQAIRTQLEFFYFVKQSVHIQNQETITHVPQWRAARLNLSLEIQQICKTRTGKSDKISTYIRLHGQTVHVNHSSFSSCSMDLGRKVTKEGKEKWNGK